MSSKWPFIELRQVISLDLHRVEVDPDTIYAMVGVYSFGRGLFRREPVQGGNTSYKYFYRLNPDHVVMSQLFGWEGAVALSSNEFAGRFVSPQFPTFRCDNSALDRRFLGWYMRRPLFWEELGRRTRGMGDRRRTLGPEALLSCSIPLPPLEEQRRIVARIEELSAKIEEARRLRKKAEESCQGLLRSILFADANDLSPRNPMHRLVRLRKPDVDVSPEETYEFAGVYCFGRGIFRGQKKRGLDFAYKSLTRIRAGDLVYPKLMAWEGALAVVSPEFEGLVVSPEFPVFEVNHEKVLPGTLDVYFRTPSVWNELGEISTGTNVRRRRLHPNAFLAYEMPLPPMSIQLRLRKINESVSRVKQLQAETAAELDALLPSILDKAFKGEL